MDKIAVSDPLLQRVQDCREGRLGFPRVLPDATVYVYDNNSTDGTAELAAGAGAVRPP